MSFGVGKTVTRKMYKEINVNSLINSDDKVFDLLNLFSKVELEYLCLQTSCLLLSKALKPHYPSHIEKSHTTKFFSRNVLVIISSE